jgi:hypothetical protein
MASALLIPAAKTTEGKMRVEMMRLVGVVAVAMSIVATGCGASPAAESGACFYTDGDNVEVCWDTDAGACAQAGGKFTESGSCFLWDLLHPPT